MLAILSLYCYTIHKQVLLVTVCTLHLCLPSESPVNKNHHNCNHYQEVSTIINCGNITKVTNMPLMYISQLTTMATGHMHLASSSQTYICSGLHSIERGVLGRGEGDEYCLGTSCLYAHLKWSDGEVLGVRLGGGEGIYREVTRCLQTAKWKQRRLL